MLFYINLKNFVLYYSSYIQHIFQSIAKSPSITTLVSFLPITGITRSFMFNEMCLLYLDDFSTPTVNTFTIF